MDILSVNNQLKGYRKYGTRMEFTEYIDPDTQEYYQLHIRSKCGYTYRGGRR